MKDVSAPGRGRWPRLRPGRAALTALSATGLAMAVLTAGTAAARADGGACAGRDAAFEPPGRWPPADPSLNVSADLNAPVHGELPGVAGGGTTFEVTDASTLPPGVGVTDGRLTGVPTQEGDYTVPVQACTAVGCTGGVLKISVGPDRSECDDKPAGPAPARRR